MHSIHREGLVLPFLLVVLLAACSSDQAFHTADGVWLYQLQCASCHGASGEGLPGLYPPLVDTDWVTGSEDRLVRVVMHGLTGTIEVRGETYRGAMPGWGNRLRPEDMAAVLTFIRTSWGNEADSVHAETVQRIAEEERGRRLPWTAEELERF